jgi:hypothetical protein
MAKSRSLILCLVFAGVTAVFAIVVSVAAKTNVVITLADAAETIAFAVYFLGAARQTVKRTGHGQECIAFCRRLKEAMPVAPEDPA